MIVSDDEADEEDLISCPGHVFKFEVLRNTPPSEMLLESLDPPHAGRTKKHIVWLHPLLYHYHGKSNPQHEENHDPSSDPLRHEGPLKPSFLATLNTILLMFHIHSLSALQIKAAFEGLQCVFSARFIQGLVGVGDPLAPWSAEQRDLVWEGMHQRMDMFRYIMALLHKRSPPKKITSCCLEKGFYILKFGANDETEPKDQLRGTEDPVYGTPSEFLGDFWYAWLESCC